MIGSGDGSCRRIEVGISHGSSFWDGLGYVCRGTAFGRGAQKQPFGGELA